MKNDILQSLLGVSPCYSLLSKGCLQIQLVMFPFKNSLHCWKAQKKLIASDLLTPYSYSFSCFTPLSYCLVTPFIWPLVQQGLVRGFLCCFSSSTNFAINGGVVINFYLLTLQVSSTTCSRRVPPCHLAFFVIFFCYFRKPQVSMKSVRCNTFIFFANHNEQCNSFIRILHHDLHLHFKFFYMTWCKCISKIYTPLSCKCKGKSCNTHNMKCTKIDA